MPGIIREGWGTGIRAHRNWEILEVLKSRLLCCHSAKRAFTKGHSLIAACSQVDDLRADGDSEPVWEQH